jgi:hypothetical protein
MAGLQAALHEIEGEYWTELTYFKTYSQRNRSWFIGNNPDLYLGGAQFEYQQGRRLSLCSFP